MLKASGSVLNGALSRGDLARLLQDDFMVLVALLSLHAGKWPPSLYKTSHLSIPLSTAVCAWWKSDREIGFVQLLP